MSNIHTLPSFTNSPLDTNLRDALNSIVTRMTNLERTNQTLQKMLEDRNGYTVTLEKVLYGLVDDMSKMNTRVDSLEREKNSMSSLISNQQIYLDQQSQHIQALQIRDQQQLILNAEMQNHLRNLQQERELVQQQFAQQQMQMHNMTEEWKSYYRRLLEHTNELRVRLQLAPISMTFQ
jgi:chromosome segregation ATPase